MNGDVEVQIGPPVLDDERLELINAFQVERATRVGWKEKRFEVDEYRQSFIMNSVPAFEFRYRVGGKLVAVAHADRSPRALNSVYCFYHPAVAPRSMGTFNILTQIQFAGRAGLEHLYLGFAVAGCRSMEYKRKFRPLESLVDGQWREEKTGIAQGG